MKIIAIIGGCLSIVIVLVDGFNTIIVARRTEHVFRLARVFYKITWNVTTAIARRIKNGRMRESFLGIYGPLSVLALLALWELGLIFGFGLLQWGAGMRADGQVLPAENVWYLSATTLLTLDSGHPQNTASRIVSAVEGGVGLAFLALMISYLPVLYEAFSSRELRIAMLDARAGSPPSAAELLQFGSGDLRRLENHLAEWEEWSAELLESSISFPMLAFFRSQHVNQSWLSALTTILDTAAVVSVCGEERAKTQAELTLAMGRHALVDIAKVFDAEPRNHSGRLSADDFKALRDVLRTSGAEWTLTRLTPEALNGARKLYEPYAQALSMFLLIALPAWIPDTGKQENWRQASKGRRPDAFAVSDPYKLPEDW